MEQTIITTAAPVTPAATAVAGTPAATAVAPESGAETDTAAQFGALLDAIKTGTAPAPAGEAPAPAAADTEEHTEASEPDADAATPAPTAATATIAVTVAMLAPAIEALAAVPISISAHARGTKSGEAATSPVITDGILPGEAPGTAPGPVVAAAPAAAPATEPVAPIVLPMSAALPTGDVDPAILQAAIAAAAESAPAKTAAAPAKTAVPTVPTASTAAAAPETAEPQTTAVGPAAETTTAAPAAAPAEATAREGASTAGNGHGGRLDLQVQATAAARPATTHTAVETPVQTIDRERVERLAEGLAARLKVSHAADGARIRMQLEPRELGEVVVRLEIRNGMAHAHLIAESADAGTALQASLADLRSSLADRGLQLDSVSIRVAGEGASNAREQAAQSQGDRRNRAPLSFGRIDGAATITAATDQLDRARDGQAVWMLA